MRQEENFSKITYASKRLKQFRYVYHNPHHRKKAIKNPYMPCSCALILTLRIHPFRASPVLYMGTIFRLHSYYEHLRVI